MTVHWWKNAVVYQIYPRSFYDSNHDGIGDLPGITQKLDYLQTLGANVLWICPMYRSPNEDNGYDISDYQEIMSEFGTMADFETLLTECHQRGMKLIIDLVLNHTSSEHAWFLESKQNKNAVKRHWYIWRKGRIDPKNPKQTLPPNNWESIFGGSAWEYDESTQEYYLHLFAPHQPDLNWENPEVRQALYGMVRWWLDKGIDGFRVDAISHIKKKAGLPNLPNPQKKSYVPSFAYHMNVAGIEAFLSELHQETFAHYDIMTVGEANGVSAAQSHFWVNEQTGIFNMIFQFEHLKFGRNHAEKAADVLGLKRALSKWQTAVENVGWNALYLENHDLPRSISAWGSELYVQESATALAMLYFFMKGTPFIYQGQEIGMTNAPFKNIRDYRDISAKNYYVQKKDEGESDAEILTFLGINSRDHARTPMQWNSEKYAGFSSHPPWIRVNPNYLHVNVAQQLQDPESIYHFYRQMIAIRLKHQTLITGKYRLLLPRHPYLFAYTRSDDQSSWTVLVNLSAQTLEKPKRGLPEACEIMLSNQKDKNIPEQLSPYSAYLYRSV